MAPIRITAHNGPWPLFDRVASQAVEAAELPRHGPGELMQRAGLATARLALARWPGVRRVLVLVGPGNNGGDGWVAAQRLHEHGMAVELVEAPAGRRLPQDAGVARAAALSAGVAVEADGTAALRRCDLVIDALLGLGSNGAPRGEVAQALRLVHLERQRRPMLPVLAVDGPSGLNLDTGQPWDDDAAPIAATATLALPTLKPGLFTAHGRDLCGEVWFDTLGVDGGAAAGAVPASARLIGPTPDGRGDERHAWHKGSRGDVWILGGDRGMEGAALLAADAAARGGAGRTWLHLLAGAEATRSQVRAVLPARPPHLLGLPAALLADPRALTGSTVVAGCGGGHAVARVLPTLLAHAGRLVLDADALNATARDPTLRQALAGRAGHAQGTVLTPHPLEAARLLGSDTPSVQANRLGAAQRLADELRACVVLKGSGSVVAAPGITPWLNASGNAALATAGSGDVLAGWLGARWSQQAHRPIDEVAAEAVWCHGDAADRWRAAGHRGVLPAHELAAWMAAPG